MIGIILCGGQSSRMGSDKGLLKLEAKTWARTAVDKIKELDLPVKLSVNKNQYPAYSSVFSEEDLVTDLDSLNVRGPLLGTLSAHFMYPNEDIFLLACDMPLMEPFILKELSHMYKNNPEHDAFVFSNDGEPEPLCGIYKSKGLASVVSLYRSGQLTRHSMKFMLYHIKAFLPPMDEEWKKYFLNFNAHAELNGL